MRISQITPARIDADIAEGQNFPAGNIEVGITGDTATLDGKTIFVVVEDPASLLATAPNIIIHADGQGATVMLLGRRQEKPGTFQGELKVHACLDASCGTELAGSPLRVPFALRVRPGLGLSKQEIAVSVPFGQQAATRSVSVTLPDAVQSWFASTSTPRPTINSPLPRLLVSQSGGPGSTPATVLLDLRPALPGTYVETANVVANVDTGPTGVLLYQRTLTVTYTVTPDPAVDVAFFPAAARLTAKVGTFSVRGDEERSVLAMPGVIAQQREIQYLAFPPQAAGHPLLDRWWIDDLNPVAQTCDFDLEGNRICLPAGTYSARIRYQIVKNGTSTDVFWPITLQVTP